MAWRSSGYVTVPTAGTPVRASDNQPQAEAFCPSHALLFQQVSGNTGKIYILDRANPNMTTGMGILAVLAIPTTNFLPSASATITYAPQGFNLAEYWIDVDVSGEKCLVSIIRA